MITADFDTRTINSFQETDSGGTQISPDFQFNRWVVSKPGVKRTSSPRIETSLVMQISTSIKQATRYINIPSPYEVKKYLVRYPELLNIFERICYKTWQEYHDSSQLILDVYHDPEIEFDSLVLLIRQVEYPENFMDSLETFREQFYGELSGMKGDIHITTDFQSPN